MNFPALALKRGEDRRLRAGHPWVFSNEVDTRRTPLTAFAPGDPVVVVDSSGKPIGSGYVNPSSLICARVLSRNSRKPFSADLVSERIGRAARLRERVFEEPYYRVVFGEGDGLPGLVVDRYGEHLVVQITTAGIERLTPHVLVELERLLNPASILLRNDATVRSLEGLACEVRQAHGETPERIVLAEDHLQFETSLRLGQKTGWFYDQRDNRRALPAPLLRDARVLDVFCYAGAWAVRAARLGAREVGCIDTSAQALELTRANAARNGVADRIVTHAGDAFDTLRRMHEGGKQYDVVILDPPAFIKRRKEHAAGVQGYRHLHREALRLLAHDGLLVTASCSALLSHEEFRGIVRQSALQSGCGLQILRQGGLPIDHPVHPALPESDYLKCLTVRIERN